MRILGFGTYDASRHPRAGVVLAGLRANGDEVVELNESLGLSTAERVAMVSKPWLAVRGGWGLLRCWLRLAMRSMRVRSDGPYDAIFVGYLGHFDVVLARLLFPRTPIVLDMLIFAADTARDRRIGGRLTLPLLNALDRLAIGVASVVVVDTDAQRALLPRRAEPKAVVVPVGASDEWFAVGERPHRAEVGPLRVAFFGLFTPLQGAPVIGEALAMVADRPDISTTMVGTGQDYPETRRLVRDAPNVTWIDWIDAAELPKFVAEHDVCLGIFGTSEKALRVVPNKVFQGAAAGCAIITSSTAPQRDLFCDAASYVPPGDPVALADVLRVLTDDRAQLAELQRRARAEALRRFRPATVVRQMREVLLGHRVG